MNLRDSVLQKLAGSSSQNPVRLEDLRAVAEPICDDPVELYDLLDQLYLDKTIQRASGYKNSKPFVSYWPTGSAQMPAAPFRICTPAPPPRAVLVRKVATPEQTATKMKPAAKPAVAVQPLSTHIQEKTMSQEQTTKKSWLKDVVALVTQQPGIKRADVVKKILLPDGSNRQSLLACISNAIYNNALRLADDKGEEVLYLGPKLTKGSKKPATKPASNKPEKKTASRAKPALAPPQRLPVPAAFDPEFSFAFGVRKDGGISIFKEGKSVSLSKSEIRTIIDHATA